MTNIFSNHDLHILKEKNFFYEKRRLAKELTKLLANLQKDLQKITERENPVLPEGTSSRGKISKGENYLGLPYFVLDYPRLFSRRSVFAFRTMIWWGNEISHTLHLQGEALEHYRPVLKKSVHKLLKDHYICVNPSSPWEYHFDEENYKKINKLSDEEINQIIKNKEFIKISRKFPLQEIDNIKGHITQNYNFLLKSIDA